MLAELVPLEYLERRSVSCLCAIFYRLDDNLWHSLTCTCITAVSASVLTWPSALCACSHLPLIRTPVIGLKAALMQYGPILT